MNRWPIIKSFFDEKKFVRQHLDSYNDFIERGLQQVIDDQKGIETDIEGFQVKFGKIRADIPRTRDADGSTRFLYPQETRLRDLTYAAPLFLELIPVTEEGEKEPVEVAVGELPVMVKSRLCALSAKSDQELIEVGEDPRDPGGYFIINGSEKVIVAIEDLAPNKILIEHSSRTNSVVAKVFSTRHGFRALVKLERKKDGLLRVSFPSVPGKIPFIAVMKALGLTRDQDIVNAVSAEPEIQKELLDNLEESIDITDEEQALDMIGKRVAIGQLQEYRLKRAEYSIDRYLLPHIGTTTEDRIRKAYYLGIMADRAIELALAKREEDDKDHYSSKRLRLAGDLLQNLFRLSLVQLTRDIKYQLERTYARGKFQEGKEHEFVKKAVRADVLTERMRHAMATGQWPGGRTGVSQLLDTVNYMSKLSHLRRVVSMLSRSQPHFEARDLHPTHWGRICPSETPEGPNCGLVKNLALMCEVAVGVDEEKIGKYLLEIGVKKILKKAPKSLTFIYLNGSLVGTYGDGEELVKKIREDRRHCRIPHAVNVAYFTDTNEIQINCDGGRARRPLITVEDGVPKVTDACIQDLQRGELQWSDLIERGLVEYLDAEEEENAYIAINDAELTPKNTHLEIFPAAILGIAASIVPFPEHNAAPRNSYGAGMAKQSLGFGASNYKLRVETREHLMHYPQGQLVTTKVMKTVGFDKRPAGQNFIVAVLSYTGYNLEDALIINKAAIERGLARTHFFRTYTAEERRYPGGQVDIFEIPDKTIRGYRGAESYKYLDDDGLAWPETVVNGGEVLIGRTSPPRFLQELDEFGTAISDREETSISARISETGIVDLTLLTETQDGNKLVKIKVRDERIPEPGDKFASRHGQKGVIGLILPMEDMPVTESGITPDMIVNPHAIPSRKTVGQILEMMAGKAACLQGEVVNATAFDNIGELDIRNLLKKNGFRSIGTERLYNGITGELIEADIFIGVCYYQKLHHMVADKMHARSRGPRQMLTRQPTEGKAREGGLRFGEMERDCLVGHGAAMLLKERLLDASDMCEVLVCAKCGDIAVYDRIRDRRYCPTCGEDTEIYPVEMSYAFKLLLEELKSMCLSPKLILKARA
jgi:DNA-directed RNA polymerase subunit B